MAVSLGTMVPTVSQAVFMQLKLSLSSDEAVVSSKCTMFILFPLVHVENKCTIPWELLNDPKGQLVSVLIGHEGDNRKKGLKISLIGNIKK